METTEERIVAVTRRVIEEAVQTGPAVFVGRGAQCLLAERSDALHVFCYAPRAALRRYVMEKFGVDAARSRPSSRGPEQAARAVREAPLESQLARARELSSLREHRLARPRRRGGAGRRGGAAPVRSDRLALGLVRPIGAFELREPRSRLIRDEHVVGDRRDFLGVLPRRLEQRELSLERATLALLVRRHLEREPHFLGKSR